MGVSTQRPSFTMNRLALLLSIICLQQYELQTATALNLFGGRKLQHSVQSLSTTAVGAAGRNLQDADDDESVCDFIFANVADPDSVDFCTCEPTDEDTFVLDCIYTECPDCQVLQADDQQEEETCAVSEDGVVLAFNDEGTFLDPNVFFGCVQYVTGSFADTTVCLVESVDGTCSVTVGEETCNSCDYITCDDDEGLDSYIIDCSNIEGFGGGDEEWNLCSADIPDTTPLVMFGSNNAFFFEDCAVEYYSGSQVSAAGVAVSVLVSLLVVCCCLVTFVVKRRKRRGNTALQRHQQPPVSAASEWNGYTDNIAPAAYTTQYSNDDAGFAVVGLD